MGIKSIEIGLDLGSKFLTYQSAYFLGLLMANEQIEFNNKTYWQAPVKHNVKHFTYLELEEHYTYISQVSQFLNKSDVTQLSDFYREQNIPIVKFNTGKKGIVTLFEQIKENYSIEELIVDIDKPLKESEPNVKKAFLVGAFDGRSSYDKTAKFVTLDYNDGAIRDIISDTLNSLNIKSNINSSESARKRKGTSSAPRRSQIRIKHIEYLENIGFISPIRFNKATESLPDQYELAESNDILPSLKFIENKQKRLFK